MLAGFCRILIFICTLPADHCSTPCICLINVSILPNFKQFTFKKNTVSEVIEHIKLVYFSRICEEKGILFIPFYNENSTNVKQRIMAHRQQVVRLNYGEKNRIEIRCKRSHKIY